MKMIIEPSRQIPVINEADLVVVGGSCTGVFAAVRAARLGLRVVIVEKQNCFGGAATAGNVHVWHRLTDTTGERQIIGGLTQEVLDRLERLGAVGEIPHHGYRLNTEELKIELDQLIREHDIIPYLHTWYAAPVVEDGRLTAILVENKNGRSAIRGQQFIDASGDGDLALGLGLPSHEPETFQPPTTCAKICGLAGLGDFDWRGAIREHGAEFGLEDDWGWGGPIPGLPDMEMRADTHVFGCDGADGDQLTAAEMEGRRQVRAMMDVARKYGPPESAMALVDLAATIGVRETKRIEASYRLTGEDVLYGRPFEDAIANGTYQVDIHHGDGPGITFRFLNGSEIVIPERGAEPVRGRWREPLDTEPTFYQVPWRSLRPKSVPNLVLAGRLLDADKVAFSAVRVMVNLNQTGEAAGVACALAVEANGDAGDVEASALRDALGRGGSILV